MKDADNSDIVGGASTCGRQVLKEDTIPRLTEEDIASFYCIPIYLFTVIPFWRPLDWSTK